jgi:hypothetical protein
MFKTWRALFNTFLKLALIRLLSPPKVMRMLCTIFTIDTFKSYQVTLQVELTFK